MKLLHTLMALALTFVLGLHGTFSGHPWLWWAAAASASMFFAGREIAQAEYRWIERHGQGLRSNMSFGSIWTTPGIWSEKSWMWDAVLPAVASLSLATWHTELLRAIEALAA